METAGNCDQRCDRSLSTDRTQTRNYPRMLAGAGTIPESGRNHHQESTGHTRQRFTWRACGVFLRCRERVIYIVRRRITARVVAEYVTADRSNRLYLNIS